MIQEINDRVGDLLEDEVRQREETEERLIELLESTC